ncbi:oxygen-dependent coproporphyrinogen oxidase [Candidatus Kinetoplastidibacterium crithidiae]|uniref:coproporphyrinogen oxidase n=2 Tax=Candidatus Kinetoplastidibacterium crithidiae TaxID=33056 RepID=M1L426_9PROT|nr:oxygen-dependent coproporphyrinogen oxidase [Candidatus Kinetoplastibacterium crithidii]AEM25254.1 coproporphyrinogen III oxidase [Candidatus Kinetoplastibacterium crithidii]AFZ82855.1 coproporphyrinogen III oxidase [Candidatus Kinetoplastibacterium crithidii (ex Angomonas deanei ATCC 30255)]AGF47493.1 coproporphyrinogen III oxidase CPOX [Candidatus Kinetoplastibacterium crithidii TCC036E]
MQIHRNFKTKEYFTSLQKNIVSSLEEIECQKFLYDPWNNDKGEGLSCLIENGKVFERAAVLFSNMKGDKLPPTASEKKPDLHDAKWEAMGVSLVIHPKNPYVPTTHMNVRLFMAKNHHGNDVFWFGGGMDLTPYYVFEEDAKHFHTICYQSLKPFGSNFYKNYKNWCDKYFFIKHRNEARGIGGIFFDDLNEPDFATSFNIVKSVGDNFVNAYLPIVKKRNNIEYSEKEREFQLYRRSRYVEFNLIYDRGTSFGLQSEGRTESILLSMPPTVKWQYNYNPSKETPEFLLNKYLHPREWL